MTTVAVAMVKDEADIICTVVRHMATHVDAVIVADNMSTDGTAEILREVGAELGERLYVFPDKEPGYYQSAKMTALARRAREIFGADWIVPFDADEIWYSPHADRVADVLEGLAPQWLVAQARLYDHVATGADPDLVDPVRRMKWRRTEPGALPKVAVRWRDDLVIGMGNHDAHYDGGPSIWPEHQIVIRHFPYRSAEQFTRKAINGAKAYAAAPDLRADYGTHWKQYGALIDNDPEAGGEIFRTWFWTRDPTEKASGLTLDPAPARRR
ncbi:MAG: glycosyltransferase family 2 protein [Ilumatobacteraceae bacterium]